MEKLELIQLTHAIDRDLLRLAAAVTDGGVKKRLAALHGEWRDLAYAVTADLCGMATGASSDRPRRGRRKRDGGVDGPGNAGADPGQADESTGAEVKG